MSQTDSGVKNQNQKAESKRQRIGLGNVTQWSGGTDSVTRQTKCTAIGSDGPLAGCRLFTASRRRRHISQSCRRRRTMPESGCEWGR